MAFQLPEPPEWWVKYKPLRWVLLALVVYWMLFTLLPRWREEPALPSVPKEVATAETETMQPEEAPPAEPAPAPEPPVPEPPPPEPVPAPEPAPPAEPPPLPSPAEPPPEPAPDPMARYTQVESERVQLINGLRSYESVESTRGVLEQAGFSAELETIERTRRSSSDPPFRNDTLTVKEYQHGEFTGRLTLEFLNDRLYRTEFAPEEAGEYLDWLRARGLKLPAKRIGVTKMSAGHLDVSSNIDFASSDVGSAMGTKPFVRWEDSRLTEQLAELR